LSFVGVIPVGQEGRCDQEPDAGSEAVDLGVEGAARFLLAAPFLLPGDALLAVEGLEGGDYLSRLAGADIVGDYAIAAAALGVVVALVAAFFPGHGGLLF